VRALSFLFLRPSQSATKVKMASPTARRSKSASGSPLPASPTTTSQQGALNVNVPAVDVEAESLEVREQAASVPRDINGITGC